MDPIYKVKATQLEMLHDRGYDLGDEEALTEPAVIKIYYDVEEGKLTKKRFESVKANPSVVSDRYKKSDKSPEEIRSGMTKSYTSKDGKRTCLVYYAPRPAASQLNIATLRQFISFLIPDVQSPEGVKIKYDEAILITPVPLNSASANELNDTLNSYKKITIQVFEDRELMFNVTRHIDVPHQVLHPREDIPTLMKSLNTKPNNMPMKRHIDPVVRYYNWKIGDIVVTYRDDFYLDLSVTRYKFYATVTSTQ